jgi:integrase
MGWHEIKRFLITAGEGIRADRERALLSVGYDTMARRSELVALKVEDFSFSNDSSGRVLIRRSKTDQTGEGSVAYLSPDTAEYLKAWLRVSRISSGAVFRRLIGRGERKPCAPRCHHVDEKRPNADPGHRYADQWPCAKPPSRRPRDIVFRLPP